MNMYITIVHYLKLKLNQHIHMLSPEQSLIEDRDGNKYTYRDWIALLTQTASVPQQYSNAQWFASNALESLTKYNWHRTRLSPEEQIGCVQSVLHVLCTQESQFEAFIMERLASAAVYGIVRCYPSSISFVRESIVTHIMRLQQQVIEIDSSQRHSNIMAQNTHTARIRLNHGVLFLWKNVIEESFGSNSFRSRSLSTQLKGFRSDLESMTHDVLKIVMECVCQLWDAQASRFRAECSVLPMLHAVRVTINASMSQSIIKCISPIQVSLLMAAAKSYSNGTQVTDSEIAESLFSVIVECAGTDGQYAGVDEMLCALLEGLSQLSLEARESIVKQSEDSMRCLFDSTDTLVTKQLTRIEKSTNLSTSLGLLLNEVLILTRVAASETDVDAEIFTRCISFWGHLISHLLVAAEAVEDGGILAKTDGASRCGALASFLKSGLLQLAETLIHALFFCGNCVHISAISNVPESDDTKYEYSLMSCIEAQKDVKYSHMRSDLWEYQKSLLDIISSLVYVYGDALVPICLQAASAGVSSAQSALTEQSIQDVAMSMMLMSGISGIHGISVEHIKRVDGLLLASIDIFQRVHTIEVCHQQSQFLQSVRTLAIALSVVNKSFAGHLATYWIKSCESNPQFLNSRLPIALGCLIQCACSSILDENCQMTACAALRACILSWRFDVEIMDFQTTLNITSALRQECLGSGTTRGKLSIESEARLWACTAEGLFTLPQSIEKAMKEHMVNEMVSIASGWTANLIAPIADIAESNSPEVDHLSALRTTRIVCSLLSTCCGSSKEYKYILFQSLFRHIILNMHKVLIKLVNKTKPTSLETSIICFILSSDLNLIRNFRPEVGSLMKDYVQDMIDNFLRDNAIIFDENIWHHLLQFLKCINKDTSNHGSSLIQPILSVCEKSLLQYTRYREEHVRVQVLNTVSDTYMDICHLALTIPIEIMIKHWRTILKLSEINSFNFVSIIQRSIHLTLVEEPYPPPSTVKSVLLCLRELFTIHKKINLSGEESSIMLPIMRAIMNDHFDSIADDLLDLLFSIAVRNDNALEDFSRRILPSLLSDSRCNYSPLHDSLQKLQASCIQTQGLQDFIYEFICNYKLCV